MWTIKVQVAQYMVRQRIVHILLTWNIQECIFHKIYFVMFPDGHDQLRVSSIFNEFLLAFFINL